MSLLRKYIRQIILEHEGSLDGRWTSTGVPNSAGGTRTVSDTNSDNMSWSSEDDTDDGPPDDLLIEPDFVEDPDEEGKDIRKEISAISGGGGAMTSTNAIGGATTPLGTGPTYPSKKKKKKRKKKGKYPTYGTLSSDD